MKKVFFIIKKVSDSNYESDIVETIFASLDRGKTEEELKTLRSQPSGWESHNSIQVCYSLSEIELT